MAAFPDVGFENMSMRLVSATAMSSSPFTFDQQIFQHPGVRWEAEVTLVPLTRSDAKEVEGFFASLRGVGGTFEMGNPLHNITATGSITSGSKNATTVDGTVTGAGVGDYFEIGGALYIITGKTASTLDIMPPLRTAISASTTMVFSLPKGTWRLASNQIGWDINAAGIYGFTFACVEAI